MRNKDMTSHEFCTAVQICNVVDNENKAGFVPRRLCNICQVSDLRNAVETQRAVMQKAMVRFMEEVWEHFYVDQIMKSTIRLCRVIAIFRDYDDCLKDMVRRSAQVQGIVISANWLTVMRP